MQHCHAGCVLVTDPGATDRKAHQVLLALVLGRLVDAVVCSVPVVLGRVQGG